MKNQVPPTLRELVEVRMPKNIADSRANVRQVQREMSGMTLTDSRREQAVDDILRFKSDARHFSNRLMWWGQKLHDFPQYANRPACDVLTAHPSERKPAPVIPIRPHWNEERDIGEDPREFA